MTPDNDCVICPNCVHQFRAIPVNVQTALTAAQALAEQRGMELKARDDIQLRVDAEFENLRAELEQYKKDAERYRWLRSKICIIRGERGATFDVLNLPPPTYIAPSPDVEFDAAIDAALSAKSEGGGR